MSTTQADIFGGQVKVGTNSQEVATILRTYPAAATDTGLLLWLVLKRRHAWVAQLAEEKQGELRRFLYDCESLRRRRQEERARIDQHAPSRLPDDDF